MNAIYLRIKIIGNYYWDAYIPFVYFITYIGVVA